jgi:RNA polymerase sigma-70 factor, ECF subfamily
VAGAVAQPFQGGEQIARGCVDLVNRAPGLEILERTVNGQPGLVSQQDGATAAVLAFDLADNLITHIWVVFNPERLCPWTTD